MRWVDFVNHRPVHNDKALNNSFFSIILCVRTSQTFPSMVGSCETPTKQRTNTNNHS